VIAEIVDEVGIRNKRCRRLQTAKEKEPLPSVGNEPSAAPPSVDHAIRSWAAAYPGVRRFFNLFQTNVVLCLQIEPITEDEQMLSDKTQCTSRTSLLSTVSKVTETLFCRLTAFDEVNNRWNIAKPPGTRRLINQR